ncbi:uracil phosphoribosyltransferase [Candidatus Saccharibacteria bacterium]|nr:uracil phosphoribosyltransferase [Candidatus Saccharibacteria bacterium]
MQTNLSLLNHPLIQHKLTRLRDKDTNVKEFRELVQEIAGLMCYEATRDIPTEAITIETPICTCESPAIVGKKLALVSILRAGEAMLFGALGMIPVAKVGHIGTYRDPHTKKPVDYYCKLPPDINQRSVIVLDPMLATGGTAVDAVDRLKEQGASDIKFLCIIAAPEGIAFMQQKHPDIPIYACAIDSHLDDHAYIVPGLGDAGDRIFGTK